MKGGMAANKKRLESVKLDDSYSKALKTSIEEVKNLNISTQSQNSQNSGTVGVLPPHTPAPVTAPPPAAADSETPSVPSTTTAIRESTSTFKGVPRTIIKASTPVPAVIIPKENQDSPIVDSSQSIQAPRRLSGLILTEDECIEAAYKRAVEFLSFWEKVDADGNGVLDEKELSIFFKNKDDAKAILDCKYILVPVLVSYLCFQLESIYHI